MNWLSPMRRMLLALVCLLPLSTACRDADTLARLVPKVIAPGSGGGAPSVRVEHSAPPALDLPPRQPHEGFEFESAGQDPWGNQLFRIRILQDGHPYQVATTKLTPLFQFEGKTAATYVSESYFQANPHRTPFSIQAGDEFTLRLTPQAFVVRWQEEREEALGHPARLREYVSERGDRLRFYLTDPFPIRYELLSHDADGRATLVLHPDLAYLLSHGRTDLLRVAQLIYRVPDPDLFQMEAVRRLAATLRSGTATTIQIDRQRQYLDQVRQDWQNALRVERVQDPGRSHLARAVFPIERNTRAVAIEDGVANRVGVHELDDGQVFRIEYLRTGEVRVYYKTGVDDARGKRDPYQLRENERWSAIYQRLLPNQDAPVKWGPGVPSDLDPFPTARDPSHKPTDASGSYDYLVPGRTVVLTFQPVRTLSTIRAELELHDVLRDIRDRYRAHIEEALDFVERQQKKPNGV